MTTSRRPQYAINFRVQISGLRPPPPTAGPIGRPSLACPAGTNHVRAYALDAAGNASTTNNTTVISSNALTLHLRFASAHPWTTNGMQFTLDVTPGLHYRIEGTTNFIDWISQTESDRHQCFHELPRSLGHELQLPLVSRGNPLRTRTCLLVERGRGMLVITRVRNAPALVQPLTSLPLESGGPVAHWLKPLRNTRNAEGDRKKLVGSAHISRIPSIPRFDLLLCGSRSGPGRRVHAAEIFVTPRADPPSQDCATPRVPAT